MKYPLLVHNGPDAWAVFNRLSEKERDQIVGEYLALAQTPGVVDDRQLHPADTATTVRVLDGRTLTTDGPFIEAKEELGGYFLHDAEDLDAAIGLAARMPAARMGGAVEVRPAMER